MLARFPANSDWRVLATTKPPVWTGDLDDNGSARWAGFMLRAERMDNCVWWWCIYEDGAEEQLASSNDHEAQPCASGEAARSAAEQAARRWLGLGPEG